MKDRAASFCLAVWAKGTLHSGMKAPGRGEAEQSLPSASLSFWGPSGEVMEWGHKWTWKLRAPTEWGLGCTLVWTRMDFQRDVVRGRLLTVTHPQLPETSQCRILWGGGPSARPLTWRGDQELHHTAMTHQIQTSSWASARLPGCRSALRLKRKHNTMWLCVYV